MTTNSKNSTKISYDIQKIRRKVQTTPRTPIQFVYKPYNYHKSFEANLGGFDNSRYRQRRNEFDTDEYFNSSLSRKIYTSHTFQHHPKDHQTNFRLRRLFNFSHWNHNDDLWLYTPSPTRDFSSRFNVDFKKPVFDVPENDVSTLSHKPPPVFIIWLVVSAVLFCLFCVLRLIVNAERAPSAERSVRRRLAEEREFSNTSPANPQENNSDNGSFRLLVNSEYSPQTESNSDLPPPYIECTSNNDGVVNKNFDITSEEQPPPYSTYLETLNNTDEIPKVHKEQSAEEPQSRTGTEVHLNNIADTNRSNIVRNSSDDVTLSRVVETTIDINDVNDGFTSNQT